MYEQLAFDSSKHLTDSDIITKDATSVKYKLSFTPDETNKSVKRRITPSDL